jgi:hypothetical protein
MRDRPSILPGELPIEYGERCIEWERERIVAHAQRAAAAYFAIAERVDDHPSFFAGCAMRSFAARIERGEHEGGNDA